MISTPNIAQMDLDPSCVLGDSDKTYGRDFICSSGYNETLLPHPTPGAIVSAYPFVELPAQGLRLT